MEPKFCLVTWEEENEKIYTDILPATWVNDDNKCVYYPNEDESKSQRHEGQRIKQLIKSMATPDPDIWRKFNLIKMVHFNKVGKTFLGTFHKTDTSLRRHYFLSQTVFKFCISYPFFKCKSLFITPRGWWRGEGHQSGQNINPSNRNLFLIN